MAHSISDFYEAVKAVLQKEGVLTLRVGLIRGVALPYAVVSVDGSPTGKKVDVAHGVSPKAGDLALLVNLDRNSKMILVATYSPSGLGHQMTTYESVLAPPDNFTVNDYMGFILAQWAVPIAADVLYEVQINDSDAEDDEDLSETVALTKAGMALIQLTADVSKFVRIRSITHKGNVSGFTGWIEGTSLGLPVHTHEHVHWYLHTQAFPALVWTVEHNMGRNPSVTITDLWGELSFADIVYVDDNTLTITFSEEIYGYAYLV